MNFNMDFGDTNFIGLVDSNRYDSFVDEDWTLQLLLRHFAYQIKIGSILVFQMTEEGIEHSWNIGVTFEKRNHSTCFRSAEGYIRVTGNSLYFVDYGCLTMSAQFEDEKIPDKNCSMYKVDIKNGVYKVEIIQFYNADNDKYTGLNNPDILFNFIEVTEFVPNEQGVFWYTYC